MRLQSSFFSDLTLKPDLVLHPDSKLFFYPQLYFHGVKYTSYTFTNETSDADPDPEVQNEGSLTNKILGFFS